MARRGGVRRGGGRWRRRERGEVAAVRVESEGAVGLTVQREPRGRRVRNRTDYDIIPLFLAVGLCISIAR
jgi:hypothetical protein